jgi:hypothetical protein
MPVMTAPRAAAVVVPASMHPSRLQAGSVARTKVEARVRAALGTSLKNSSDRLGGSALCFLLCSLAGW